MSDSTTVTVCEVCRKFVLPNEIHVHRDAMTTPTLIDQIRAALELKRMKGEPYNPQKIILNLVAAIVRFECHCLPEDMQGDVKCNYCEQMKTIADLKKELRIE